MIYVILISLCISAVPFWYHFYGQFKKGEEVTLPVGDCLIGFLFLIPLLNVLFCLVIIGEIYDKHKAHIVFTYTKPLGDIKETKAPLIANISENYDALSKHCSELFGHLEELEKPASIQDQKNTQKIVDQMLFYVNKILMEDQ